MDTLPQLLDITKLLSTFSLLQVLWGVAFFLLVICVGYSLLLFYHAIRYGKGSLVITVGMVVYVVVATILLLGMFSSVAIIAI